MKIACLEIKDCEAESVKSKLPDAILLIATNPVDVMSQASIRIPGLSRERVIGSGTVRYPPGRVVGGRACRLRLPQNYRSQSYRS